jgi:hypothetical protein
MQALRMASPQITYFSHHPIYSPQAGLQWLSNNAHHKYRRIREFYIFKR